MLKIILGMLVFFHTIIHAQEDFLSSFEQEYSTQDISDPLYHYNHFMHAVNWNVYDYALSPLLETYNKSIPLGYRLGIYNFFDNLASPLRFIALLLAFEPKKAMDELGRFMLNSFGGILGIFDVASENQLYSHDIDFGITLGKWGIGSGAYVVLPILGPSNVRDTITMPLNMLLNPTSYLNPTSLSIGSNLLGKFSYTAQHKKVIDNLRKGAIGNDYILIRNSYMQHRLELIKGDL